VLKENRTSCSQEALLLKSKKIVMQDKRHFFGKNHMKEAPDNSFNHKSANQI
jgi:hypothetical protein